MPIPILATKLYIPPPRSGVVLRVRLIERLNEGMRSTPGVTLISAPAGFGKTTLVSEWAADCGHLKPKVRAISWLSLDEGDNDPSRFLTYLVAALQTLTPETGGVKMDAGVLEALQAPQSPPIESILIALLNEITTIPDNFVLVLDDYHLIDSKSVDEALTFLLKHLPPQMQLVIITREDPHLPIAQLRARRQLTELRAADLRFTPAEAAEFLNQVMRLNLSTEDIAALETRTEGWIAGLQLAALALQGPVSMQGRSDAASFIQAFTGSHRFVLDYLVEEVLQRQPEGIHSFLLKTAILDRLSGSLCDAVTSREDSKGLLETLERSNLFIIPLDDQRQWYRYHPLFAEVLQARLQDEHPDQKFSLHQRASEWYEQHGMAADAIWHALAAKDFERAATLIERAEPEMRKSRQGATATELGWLKTLPDELVRFRPVLSVAYAYALFNGGELEVVETRLRDAERWLDPADRSDPMGPKADMRTQPEVSTVGMVVVDEKEFRRLPGMIALLRTAQALARNDMPETVKNAQRVLDLAPEDDYLMLGGAASTLGLAAWARGDLDAARRLTADGMANVRRAGYISSAIGAAITLADIQVTQGHLHEAMATYEQGLRWATELGRPVQRGAADMHVGMSALHREHNHLEIATQHLLTSQALGELAGMPQNPYRWCAAMARVRETQGDLDGALDLLSQAERRYEANFSPNVRPIAARKTRVWVELGQLDQALGWVRAQGLDVDNELSYLREFDHITLVRVLLARYQSEHAVQFVLDAMELLERLRKAAEEGRRTGSLIEVLILQALAHQARGDTPAALKPLQHALALAEPEGYIRIFLDEGSSMMQMLREAAARETKPRQGLQAYTVELLATLEAEKRKSEDKSPFPPTQPLIESAPLFEAAPPQDAKERSVKTALVDPLSQRELKILQLIAQGLSNREIGARLFIALDTVKGHNRNIFDKLQVQSRTEAIARARELGLL